MKLEQINKMSRKRFVEKLGWLFEHSPWVAERAWTRRPFTTLEALYATLVDQVERATPEEQLALLRAHPELGRRARMSPASAGEQAGAGLDRQLAAEKERLRRLTAAYRRKFGFPFLFAVRGSTKTDILEALEHRLKSTREREFRQALDEIYRIARFRLQDTITDWTEA